MEGTTHPSPSTQAHRPLASLDAGPASPFSQQRVTITKQEHIDLVARASYWEAQHARAKAEIDKLRQEVLLKDAKIKDLRNRLFGKKSEKSKPLKSEKGGQGDSPSKRQRGQQPGSQGHGRTKRPDLPVIHEQSDLSEDAKRCPTCGLEHLPRPALDEHSDVIEVEVKAHRRRIRRPAYTRNPGCTCEGTPAILTAPPPARLIPRSDYGVSFWVEVILSKYRYGQPSHRLLQDLADQGLPVSPGTLAGGLQAIPHCSSRSWRPCTASR
jgi:transposase